MILMYHNIAEEAGFNTVTESQFISQLGFILENGYKVISLEDYVESRKNNNFRENSLCITFDDAYKSFAEKVVPIMVARSMPVTVFVPSGYIGMYNVWDEDASAVRLEIMNEPEIRDLTKTPLVTIGSHGISHRPLAKLDSSELKNEIIGSKTHLEIITGKEIKYFSYPFGQHKHFSAMAVKLLKEAGYEAALSTNWNRFNSTLNLFSLNRIEIEPKDTIEDFRQKIHSKYHLKYYKQKVKNLLRL